MTINTYRWDDGSAPVLRGVVGDMTTLLDAILVNGYGSKTAAGWAIAFTATNQRAYRAASGNRIYLAVDDTNPAPGSYGALATRLTAYETMTSATAGTKPSPSQPLLTTASITGTGVVALKSQTNDTTQRPWIAYVSETFIHLHVFIATSVANGVYNSVGINNIGGFMFGDLVNQQKAGDAYATILIAGATTTPSNSNPSGTLAGGSSNSLGTHYLQRAYHQANNAIGCTKSAVTRGIGSTSVIGGETNAPNFPDPITGGMEISEIWVYEQTSGTAASARGRIPGLYHPLHNLVSMTASFQVGDAIPGAGTYAGTTFQVCTPGNGACGLMQITGTW